MPVQRKGGAADAPGGRIFAIRGNVVDVGFAPPLPPRHQALRAGERGDVVLEVQWHVGTDAVRCIGLTATRRLPIHRLPLPLARRPLPCRACCAFGGRAFPRRDASRRAAAGRQHLPLRAVGHRSLRSARPHPVTRRLPADPRHGARRRPPVGLHIAMLGFEELSQKDRETVAQARRLERFLTQPFFTTEHFTGMPGSQTARRSARL